MLAFFAPLIVLSTVTCQALASPRTPATVTVTATVTTTTTIFRCSSPPVSRLGSGIGLLSGALSDVPSSLVATSTPAPLSSPTSLVPPSSASPGFDINTVIGPLSQSRVSFSHIGRQLSGLRDLFAQTNDSQKDITTEVAFIDRLVPLFNTLSTQLQSAAAALKASKSMSNSDAIRVQSVLSALNAELQTLSSQIDNTVVQTGHPGVDLTLLSSALQTLVASISSLSASLNRSAAQSGALQDGFAAFVDQINATLLHM
ncbi:hypothetical protein MIND_01167800 [Mycena indigotica]|uniref:Uncharacterized protein n=1 Tax=Mycena indigotica TaxID=2126181 RepID=A0A8H6VUR5_9AGAR|nr:uncharacterized protein MIND_01167800 [Mycena indigotica]KAF7292696.1 hypothetical protein MIND_01167800 [Mycena indigotica]